MVSRKLPPSLFVRTNTAGSEQVKKPEAVGKVVPLEVLWVQVITAVSGTSTKLRDQLIRRSVEETRHYFTGWTYVQPLLSALQLATKLLTSNSVTARCSTGAAETAATARNERMAECFMMLIQVYSFQGLFLAVGIRMLIES
jgi:hypothetical protein